jgi:hypothetical protein
MQKLSGLGSKFSPEMAGGMQLSDRTKSPGFTVRDNLKFLPDKAYGHFIKLGAREGKREGHLYTADLNAPIWNWIRRARVRESVRPRVSKMGRWT